MILFFNPVPRFAIWGGKACNAYFHNDFPDGVGQVWAFSAQDGDGLSTVCASDPFEGKTLKELWKEAPQLFGDTDRPFPLIISLVAPEDDLSIQVHPDSEEAQKKSFPMGKNEAWYFIQCQEGASIVYNHNMRDRAQMEAYMQEDRWDEILRHRSVKDGDFVYIPAGMMHAMGKGVVVYEIQQSTDITYRFYDYHRKDAEGHERKLDVKDALASLHYEADPVLPAPAQDGSRTIFIQNDSFTVSRLEVTEGTTFTADPYQLATVVKGRGTADGQPVQEGSSFLIPAGETVALAGDMTIMMTTA